MSVLPEPVLEHARQLGRDAAKLPVPADQLDRFWRLLRAARPTDEAQADTARYLDAQIAGMQ